MDGARCGAATQELNLAAARSVVALELRPGRSGCPHRPGRHAPCTSFQLLPRHAQVADATFPPVSRHALRPGTAERTAFSCVSASLSTSNGAPGADTIDLARLATEVATDFDLGVEGAQGAQPTVSVRVA